MTATKTTCKLPRVRKIPEDPAKARVAIAKDVLKQLDVVKPTYGVYVCPVDWEELIDQDVPARRKINEISDKCQVCALGACILSYIRLYNELRVRQLIQYKWRGKLAAVFGYDRLDCIEHYFEDRRKVNPREVIKKIMENIIANNGEFTLYVPIQQSEDPEAAGDRQQPV